MIRPTRRLRLAAMALAVAIPVSLAGTQAFAHDRGVSVISFGHGTFVKFFFSGWGGGGTVGRPGDIPGHGGNHHDDDRDDDDRDDDLKSFRIRGDLVEPLTPGTGGTLDLALKNRDREDIRIRDLVVTLDRVTSPNGRCNAGRNFAVTQFSGRYRDLVIPGRTTLTLSELGVAADDLPRVEMIETGRNQDGCKGATLYLVYDGRARAVNR